MKTYFFKIGDKPPVAHDIALPTIYTIGDEVINNTHYRELAVLHAKCISNITGLPVKIYEKSNETNAMTINFK